MNRSHPPTLLRLVARLLREHALFAPGDRVLCACSGGPDSSAMLHVLARLRSEVGFELHAHGVDHGLRPEAEQELELARNVAASASVPFEVTRVAVERGGNLQARARSARYEALERAASSVGAKAIATGHTLDDRAETFLLRLLRGSGPQGLAVLPPRSKPMNGLLRVRPLIEARRSDVLRHLERHEIPWASDPSNTSEAFQRVRVRREVLPLLESLSPKIVDHLAALATMLDGDRSDPLSALGRSQRDAIARAARLGRSSVRVLVPGGREVEATFRDGQTVLTEHRVGATMGQRNTGVAATPRLPYTSLEALSTGDDSGGMLQSDSTGISRRDQRRTRALRGSS